MGTARVLTENDFDRVFDRVRDMIIALPQGEIDFAAGGRVIGTSTFNATFLYPNPRFIAMSDRNVCKPALVLAAETIEKSNPLWCWNLDIARHDGSRIVLYCFLLFPCMRLVNHTFLTLCLCG